MADNKNLNTVQQYVGDMVSLESHIEEAMDGQMKEVKNNAAAVAAVRDFHQMVKRHREAMKAHLREIGGSESHPVKEAVSNLFGKAAGVIDNLRTQGESKALRDDYTAFNHAAIGYAMLHTTAHALGQQSTMDIAERHMRDYAEAVQRINQIMPQLVIFELREDGHAVQDVSEHCTGVINRVWSESKQSSSSYTSSTSALPKAA